jgi:hypothetical protein
VPRDGNGYGLFSFPLLIPADAQPGLYTFEVDAAGTQFNGIDGTVPMLAGGVTISLVVPEPSAAAALLGACGGALLWRRRHIASR